MLRNSSRLYFQLGECFEGIYASSPIIRPAEILEAVAKMVFLSMWLVPMYIYVHVMIIMKIGFDW